MKRKWLSRALATMLASVMAAGMLTGCGGEKAPVSSSETDDVSTETQNDVATETEVVEGEFTYPVDTDVKISYYIAGKNLKKTDKYENYNDVPFYKGLSENTGIEVDWQAPVVGADIEASYNLLLQEEVLPTIIYKEGFNASVTQQLYSDGLIQDLTEYLPKYAPDFWEWINDPAHEADKLAVTNDEGKFLYMPAAREAESNITYLGPVIRQDWLEEQNLNMPVTLEDWENVLTVFKEKYNARLGFKLGRFNVGGALASGTGAHGGLELKYYVEDGEIKTNVTDPAWKELVTVLNRWHEAGLIDADFTTAGDPEVRTKALNNELGVIVTAMSQLTNFIADAEAEGTGAEWVGFEYPRTAAGDATSYINTEATLVKVGSGCVITTSATEEELIAALQFLNYGYDEEGTIYINFGEEGVAHTVSADGSHQFTDLILKDERGVNDALNDYTGVVSNGGSFLQLAEFVKNKNNEASVAAVDLWTANSDAAQYLVPSFTRTEEEQSLYTDLHAVLNTYVSEMALKFVTGEESLDKFDDFLKQVEAYGLSDLLASEQAAYDRYVNR